MTDRQFSLDEKQMLYDIASQLQKFNVKKILLFGSFGTPRFNAQSDVDLCVVMDTENKRETLTAIYMDVSINKPLDILLYNPQDWANCIEDPFSFAFKINKEGVLLYENI